MLLAPVRLYEHSGLTNANVSRQTDSPNAKWLMFVGLLFKRQLRSLESTCILLVTKESTWRTCRAVHNQDPQKAAGL